MDRLRNTVWVLAMLAVPAGAHTFLAAPSMLCFTNGFASYRISTRVASPDYRVKIENKAARPDLRIAIVDTPDIADFVLVDDFAGIVKLRLQRIERQDHQGGSQRTGA